MRGRVLDLRDEGRRDFELNNEISGHDLSLRCMYWDLRSIGMLPPCLSVRISVRLFNLGITEFARSERHFLQIMLADVGSIFDDEVAL